MMASLSGTLATMGPGNAVRGGGEVRLPRRGRWRMVGDGAMQMNGNNVLITISKYWQRVEGPTPGGAGPQQPRSQPGDLGAAGDERRLPSFEASQDAAGLPVRRTQSCWASGGIRVDKPERDRAAWDEAFSADRPVVVEAITDPKVPPLPPHITLEQAAAMTRALLKGDPDRGAIIRQTFRDLIEDYVPHQAKPRPGSQSSASRALANS